MLFLYKVQRKYLMVYLTVRAVQAPVGSKEFEGIALSGKELIRYANAI